MKNVLEANRKARGKLLLKRKACDAVEYSSYHEINTSSENDFVASDTDITNETHLALQLVEEDMNSEKKLHTVASLQETEGNLNPAALYKEIGDKTICGGNYRSDQLSGKTFRKIRRSHHKCSPTIAVADPEFPTGGCVDPLGGCGPPT